MAKTKSKSSGSSGKSGSSGSRGSSGRSRSRGTSGKTGSTTHGKVTKLEKGQKIRNSLGSSRDHGSTSMKKFYEKETGKSFAACSITKCRKKATDGAHVTVSGEGRKKIKIVPTCHDHNIDSSKDPKFKSVKSGTLAVER